MAFTHVLVPTDFSDSSTHALRHAIAEAALHHAKVTLLHVLPPRAGPDVYYITGAPEAGPQGGFDLITGGPPGAHLAAESTVLLRDLIVMGTHGRTGLQHVLLGSVAEKVVRLAPCPVLTLRHTQG